MEAVHFSLAWSVASSAFEWINLCVQKDGSCVAWDLREPEAQHNTRRLLWSENGNDKGISVRTPTYDTSFTVLDNGLDRLSHSPLVSLISSSASRCADKFCAQAFGMLCKQLDIFGFLQKKNVAQSKFLFEFRFLALFFKMTKTFCFYYQFCSVKDIL